jgi:hypothetical protein
VSSFFALFPVKVEEASWNLYRNTTGLSKEAEVVHQYFLSMFSVPQSMLQNIIVYIACMVYQGWGNM